MEYFAVVSQDIDVPDFDYLGGNKLKHFKKGTQFPINKNDVNKIKETGFYLLHECFGMGLHWTYNLPCIVIKRDYINKII